MKIIVPIATRSRPMRLAGALHSLTTLASGRNEIEYVVRVDSDDNDTYRVMAALKETYGCRVLVSGRPVTLAQSWNECVADSDWDACAIIADKHLCLTQSWDECIRDVIETQNRAGCRWHLITAPEETAFVMSRKWYDMKQSLLPEYFAFWFAERWQMEVHILAFGYGITLVTNMMLAEPRLKTQGLRDLDFWFDFFSKTRFMRLQEAHRLAIAFNAAPIDPTSFLADMAKMDEWQLPRIPLYYKERGEPVGEPSGEYKLCKLRAEKLLTLLSPTEAASVAV